jgi:ubiquinone/menaquinone biosynthesis C-methylase UbiE
MKDNFSLQSNQYAKFRPTYSKEFYDYLLTLLNNKQTAWDCGTGNGQVAQELSKYFQMVYGTDISEKQIQHAVHAYNIIYKVEAAEKTSFPDKAFDLIIVAQAIHWFIFDEFYKEVKRTIKPEGILVVIGYGLIQIDDSIDKIISEFYHNILGSYWDKERKYIEENYQTIPFPFEEIRTPDFENIFEWNFEQLIGYLETWSAVQHYKKKTGKNAIDNVYKDLEQEWKIMTIRKIKFPILLRIGKV